MILRSSAYALQRSRTLQLKQSLLGRSTSDPLVGTVRCGYDTYGGRKELNGIVRVDRGVGVAFDLVESSVGDEDGRLFYFETWSLAAEILS